jgi:D-3-phosphoglycerate dehydrogenase
MASAAQMSAAAPKALLPRQFRSGANSFKAAPVPVRRAAVRISASASDTDEVALLEKMLKLAKQRKEAESSSPAATGPAAGYDGKGFTIKTFNAISPVGLNKYPKGK